MASRAPVSLFARVRSRSSIRSSLRRRPMLLVSRIRRTGRRRILYRQPYRHIRLRRRCSILFATRMVERAIRTALRPMDATIQRTALRRHIRPPRRERPRTPCARADRPRQLVGDPDGTLPTQKRKGKRALRHVSGLHPPNRPHRQRAKHRLSRWASLPAGLTSASGILHRLYQSSSRSYLRLPARCTR